jgi:hypothetical protein
MTREKAIQNAAWVFVVADMVRGKDERFGDGR